jgi:endogenous inhibitor of DNA gyrase (YacG/DUF329 family)
MTSSTVTRCPTCKLEVKAPTANPVFPFCSQRCRTIDLGRWLGEAFRIGSQSVDEDEDGNDALLAPRSPDA